MEMLVNIDVDELAKAVVFYRDALGLHEERRLFGGSVVEMTGGASSKIHLLGKAPGSAALSNAQVYRTTGGTGRPSIWISSSQISKPL